MTRSDDPHSADVFDFVDEYMLDLERGAQLPLAHYLARFPRSEAAIAREWMRLHGEAHAASVADAHAPEHATTDDGAQRIGPYRLIRELGRGGQGAVYLAEDARIGRRVALKILTSHFDGVRDDQRARFRREAEVIARLEHPSLCTVYEADLEAATPYIAMRFVEGRTLAEVIGAARTDDTGSGRVRLDAGDESHARSSDTAIPPHTTLDMFQVLLFFERAARALHAAHEAGVVHRDVKPGNVIVSAEGRPVILDFGLARDERGDHARITESGEVFGTPAYMSPEQLELASEDLDRRTDVYSLGVALYEALTLHRPFEQAARSALYAAIQSDPPSDPRRFNAMIVEDVKVVLDTALEKDRGRRYPTALEFAEDLRRIREYEPIRARPAGVGLKFARWSRRHPALAVAITGTILSLSIGLAVALHLLAAEKRAVDAKDVALTEKDAAMSVALGKHLAQRSIQLVPTDASAALVLGIEAAERAPGYLTRSALYPALEGCWLEHQLVGEDTARIATGLEVGPYQRTVAISYDDGLVLVWNLVDGVRTKRLSAHQGAAEALAYDPTGARLASVGKDGFVRVFAVEDGRDIARNQLGEPLASIEFSAAGERLLVRSASGHAWSVAPGGTSTPLDSGAKFESVHWLSSDGRVLALASGCARIIDATRSNAHGIGTAGRSRVTCVEANADGTRVAIGFENGDVEVLDPTTDHRIADFALDTGAVKSVAFASHGTRISVITSGDDSNSVYVLDPATAHVISLGLPPHRLVSAAVFSPDGAHVATTSHDLALRIWDASNGVLERTFALQIRPVDVRWSRDGERLVSRSHGNWAYVWFARTRPDTFDLEGHARAVRSTSFSPDGSRALTASDDGSVRVWNTPLPHAGEHGAGVGVQLHLWNFGSAVTLARFTPSGRAIVSATIDGAVRIHDVERGLELRSAMLHDAAIADLVVTPDATALATIARDGTARVWSLDKSTGPLVLERGQSGVRALCATFVRQGAELAIGWSDDAVTIHDSGTGARLRTRRFERAADCTGDFVALAAHPTRDEIALACGDLRLRFWKVEDLTDARADIFAFELRAIAYDVQGTHLLALGRQGGRAVRVVDLKSGEAIIPKYPHAGDITSACFDPSGDHVLTTSQDGGVFLWSASSGEPLVQREDFHAPVLCAAFAPTFGDLRVLAGLESGRACVWPVDPLAAARARRPRDLAPWERDRERALAAPLDYR